MFVKRSDTKKEKCLYWHAWTTDPPCAVGLPADFVWTAFQESDILSVHGHRLRTRKTRSAMAWEHMSRSHHPICWRVNPWDQEKSNCTVAWWSCKLTVIYFRRGGRRYKTIKSINTLTHPFLLLPRLWLTHTGVFQLFTELTLRKTWLNTGTEQQWAFIKMEDRMCNDRKIINKSLNLSDTPSTYFRRAVKYYINHLHTWPQNQWAGLLDYFFNVLLPPAVSSSLPCF